MDATNLRMLIEMATVVRDAAGSRRAQAAAALQASRQQLVTLRDYAADYARRGQNTLSNGADIAAQTNLRAFVAKLERAIDQQGNEIARREQVLQAAEQEFNDAQRKLKSLQALQKRQQEHTRERTQRQEQKLLDEMAQGMRGGRERPLTVGGW